MRESFWYGLVFVAASTLMANAARAESMNCDEQPLTSHEYNPKPGDVVQPRHLELVRPFAGSGSLEVHVCDADLRVRTRPDAKDLRLTVEMSSQPGGHTAADYIAAVRVQPTDGVIQLKFPKEAHATVTLDVPMQDGSNNEFNLGRGNLDFDAAGGTGSRQINLGMGSMKLLVDGDKSYSTMDVNIGMGSLHDHRPRGHDGHFVVSRNYSGSGTGSIEVHVGMGSLDIGKE
jgi:hypothetical protein